MHISDETTPPPMKKSRCTPNASDATDDTTSPSSNERTPSTAAATSKIDHDQQQPSSSSSQVSPTVTPIDSKPSDVSSSTAAACAKPTDIYMAEPSGSTSESAANTSVHFDAGASTSSNDTSTASETTPKSAHQAERDFERNILRKIQLNVLAIWRAIDANEAEHSPANTSGSSTHSATSQPTSTCKSNEGSSETVLAPSTSATDTTASSLEQNSPEKDNQ